MTGWRPGAPPLLVALLAALLWVAAALVATRGEWGVVVGVVLGVVGLALLAAQMFARRRTISQLVAAIRAAAGGDAPASHPDDPQLADAVRAVADGIRASRELLGQSQAERAQFEHALSAAGDVVVALDGGGRIAYLNPAAQAALSTVDGVSPVRVGAPLIEVVVDPELYAAVEASRRNGLSQSLYTEREGRHYRATVVPLGEGGAWSAVDRAARPDRAARGGAGAA